MKIRYNLRKLCILAVTVVVVVLIKAAITVPNIIVANTAPIAPILEHPQQRFNKKHLF